LLRSTPLVFAVLGLLFGIAALKRLTRSFISGLVFALLLGTAPFFAFFVTDFIQEMLLACFLLLMFWAGVGYLNPGTKWKTGTWALFFGTATGLAFATKETCLISFAAAALAASPFLVKRLALETVRARVRDLVLAVLGFLITACILYSDFGRDFHGVYNAFVAAPLSYLGRAAGDATASAGANWHVHPWWQYIHWLFSGQTVLANFFCFGLAFGTVAIPMARARRERRDNPAERAPRTHRAFLFTTTYALLSLAFYSAIPYKTPWCALTFLHGWILLAGVGVAVCFQTRVSAMAGLVLALAVGYWHGMQSVRAAFRYPADPRNPYVYAHTGGDCLRLVKEIERCAAKTNGFDTPIAFGVQPSDTWPLPWYLRKYRNVGYWTNAQEIPSQLSPTLLVVGADQGDVAAARFGEGKESSFYGVRPGALVILFTPKENE
ncbi:MAG: hypothetical protein IKO55_04755, partial [Kiritimatiellae bacterium]|nr:hypothetical protein [Kiritimatiellia bacterium]